MSKCTIRLYKYIAVCGILLERNARFRQLQCNPEPLCGYAFGIAPALPLFTAKPAKQSVALQRSSRRKAKRSFALHLSQSEATQGVAGALLSLL